MHRQPPNLFAASQPVTSNVEPGTNSNTIPSDQVQSHMEIVNDTVTDSDTVPIVQIQSQPVASLKWQKYKQVLIKRREKYRLNSLPERNVLTNHIINSLNYIKVINEFLTVLMLHLYKMC